MAETRHKKLIHKLFRSYSRFESYSVCDDQEFCVATRLDHKGRVFCTFHHNSKSASTIIALWQHERKSVIFFEPFVGSSTFDEGVKMRRVKKIMPTPTKDVNYFQIHLQARNGTGDDKKTYYGIKRCRIGKISHLEYKMPELDILKDRMKMKQLPVEQEEIKKLAKSFQRVAKVQINIETNQIEALGDSDSDITKVETLINELKKMVTKSKKYDDVSLLNLLNELLRPKFVIEYNLNGNSLFLCSMKSMQNSKYWKRVEDYVIKIQLRNDSEALHHLVGISRKQHECSSSHTLCHKSTKCFPTKVLLFIEIYSVPHEKNTH